MRQVLAISNEEIEREREEKSFRIIHTNWELFILSDVLFSKITRMDWEEEMKETTAKFIKKVSFLLLPFLCVFCFPQLYYA